MNHPIHRPINAVQVQQRIQRVFDYVPWGMLAAAPIVPFSPHAFLLIIFAITIIAWLRPYPISAAARLVDRRCNLKDRTLTAVALLERSDLTPMEQLQIEDTAEHLAAVQPDAVLSVQFTKKIYFAIVIFWAIVLALSYTLKPYRATGNIESVAQTLSVESAVLLEEIVAKTEELVQKHAGEQSLANLSERLKTLMDKYEFTSRNAKESLLMLSEIDEAIQSAVDSLQLETMEESLMELAKTLELAEITFPISKALEKGDFKQAAAELRKLDAAMLESLSTPEQKAMMEQMQSLADDAEKRNQQALQEAAQKMSDALTNGDGDAGKSATDDLANEVEKYGVRKEIAKNLAMQLMSLAMMKADDGEGNMSGGDGTKKSEIAKQTWGFGSAGNPQTGNETNLQGQRQQQILTGTLGDQGESEIETVDSQEMSAATSRREYREQFQHFQKLSEAVLDSEPIPLGQRQVIRRYFESIRPTSE
jgi:hypothetical protein